MRPSLNTCTSVAQCQPQFLAHCFAVFFTHLICKLTGLPILREPTGTLSFALVIESLCVAILRVLGNGHKAAVLCMGEQGLMYIPRTPNYIYTVNPKTYTHSICWLFKHC